MFNITTTTAYCVIVIDIFVSGYLLVQEMLPKHVCLLKYGAIEAKVDDLGLVDCATLCYAVRRPLDAPWPVPVLSRSINDPDVTETRWLITGKAVFFRPKMLPYKLEYDAETRTFLNTWFSPDILKRPESKGVRFIQTHSPRDIPPVGIVRDNLQMAGKSLSMWLVLFFALVWFQHYRKGNFRDEGLPLSKWTKCESKQTWRTTYLQTIPKRSPPHFPYSGYITSPCSGHQTLQEIREEKWREEADTSKPTKVEMREMYKELGGRKARRKGKLGGTSGMRDRGGCRVERIGIVGDPAYI
ncbi:hypothetical protein C8Q74DRAFT_1372322 [Fomes fomentarius]|nr:hypothetical protein C8Q74DRAFT_1372322 [Fomes fomentarius]